MLKIIKNFRLIIGLSFVCVCLGILTFLAFVNPRIIYFSDTKLQILLIFDVILLILFFGLIIAKTLSIYSLNKTQKTGSQTSFRYVSLFSLFTFIPSFLIAIFSLFLFNYGLENFFNNQISKAVNNSYDVAKNYLEENKKTVESDVFLMSVGLNRSSPLFYASPEKFKKIMISEKLLRRVDDVFLIDSSSNIILSETNDINNFSQPSDEEFNLALQGLPVILSNTTEDKSSVMIKLNSLIDTYLYISRNIEPEISRYLKETEQAVDFYYSVENKQFGIKITFAIIYIIVVGLLLFLSTIIAITFANNLTKPIINLISASENISKGILDSKVPHIETDKEFMMLNKNFNNMIELLKKQQDKLLISERYSAWESVARKLAHEIKNPLTPIQLSIDRLQEKFYKKILVDRDEFKNYLLTINRQIKDIEGLVNEFSSFARMPSPIFKKIDVNEIVGRAVKFCKMSSKNQILFNKLLQEKFIKADEEQLNRVLINLIKNSEDSILEKKEKNTSFKGKIELDIRENNDYIMIQLLDNGMGIEDTKKIMTPYFTTKKDGTGLGLPIVSKIIHDHSGDLQITNEKEGVKVLITLPKI